MADYIRDGNYRSKVSAGARLICEPMRRAEFAFVRWPLLKSFNYVLKIVSVSGDVFYSQQRMNFVNGNYVGRGKVGGIFRARDRCHVKSRQLRHGERAQG